MISSANNISYVNVPCYIDYFGCLMHDDNIRPRCYACGAPSDKMFLFIAFLCTEPVQFINNVTFLRKARGRDFVSKNVLNVLS